jgi:hypothetical protein
VGASAHIITAIDSIYRERKFRRTLENLIDIAIIYYITEFKRPEISIFRNTAVTNIRKYYTSRIVQLGNRNKIMFF